MQNLSICFRLLPSLLEESTLLRTRALSKFNWVPSRNAGHSKWANIRHTKGANDMKRSKEMARYNLKIQIAIRAGGGSADPKLNSHLGNVVQEAKEAKLPMDTIKRLLDNFNKAKSNPVSEVWPMRGPGRAIVLVEVFSDNRAKVKMELNTVLRKNKGMWTENSAMNLFDCVGLILCSEFQGKKPAEALLEDSTTHAIEGGADDVSIQDTEEHGRVFEFTTSASALSKVKQFLSNAGYKCVASEVLYIPQSRVELNEPDFKNLTALCDKIMDHPEVVNVYDNVE